MDVDHSILVEPDFEGKEEFSDLFEHEGEAEAEHEEILDFVGGVGEHSNDVLFVGKYFVADIENTHESDYLDAP